MRTETNRGNSVASFSLFSPITAASAMSGWVRSTPSNSAGGTWNPLLRRVNFGTQEKLKTTHYLMSSLRRSTIA